MDFSESGEMGWLRNLLAASRMTDATVDSVQQLRCARLILSLTMMTIDSLLLRMGNWSQNLTGFSQ